MRVKSALPNGVLPGVQLVHLALGDRMGSWIGELSVDYAAPWEGDAYADEFVAFRAKTASRATLYLPLIDAQEADDIVRMARSLTPQVVVYAAWAACVTAVCIQSSQTGKRIVDSAIVQIGEACIQLVRTVTGATYARIKHATSVASHHMLRHGGYYRINDAGPNDVAIKAANDLVDEGTHPPLDTDERHPVMGQLGVWRQVCAAASAIDAMTGSRSRFVRPSASSPLSSGASFCTSDAY